MFKKSTNFGSLGALAEGDERENAGRTQGERRENAGRTQGTRDVENAKNLLFYKVSTLLRPCSSTSCSFGCHWFSFIFSQLSLSLSWFSLVFNWFPMLFDMQTWWRTPPAYTLPGPTSC